VSGLSQRPETPPVSGRRGAESQGGGSRLRGRVGGGGFGEGQRSALRCCSTPSQKSGPLFAIRSLSTVPTAATAARISVFRVFRVTSGVTRVGAASDSLLVLRSRCFRTGVCRSSFAIGSIALPWYHDPLRQYRTLHSTRAGRPTAESNTNTAIFMVQLGLETRLISRLRSADLDHVHVLSQQIVAHVQRRERRKALSLLYQSP